MSEAKPPVVARQEHETTFHGEHRSDPYAWLGNVEDPAVLAHIEAENRYTDALTGAASELSRTVFDEIVARTQQTDLSVPVRRGDWWYYLRIEEGQQHPRYCRLPVSDPDDWDPPVPGEEPDGREQVIFDAEAEAAAHPFFSLGAFTVSRRGDLLAYAVDNSGDERHTLRFRDLVTGADLPDTIDGVHYGAVWTADGSGVFYVEADEAWRPYLVRRHDLGSTEPDELVFAEPDERFWVGIGRSTSHACLIVTSSSRTSSECHLLELARPRSPLTLVRDRQEDLEYDVDHVLLAGQPRLLVVHNEAGPDFAVAIAEPEHPARWRTVVDEVPGRRVIDATVVADRLVVGLRRDALARLVVLPPDVVLGQGDQLGPDLRDFEVDFAEELFDAGAGQVSDPRSPYLPVTYGSFLTPPTVYDLDPVTGALIERKRTRVLGGYRPQDYVQHREWAVAEDGTRIPVSVVARRDTPRDGTAPLLVYGYGAYESTMDPFFSVPRLSLLDRGVVFAVVHVRGGGELGRAWYEGGRLEHKINTFTDFVAGTRALLDAGRGDPNRVAVLGGSAGGLLVGAVLNLAPELYTAALAEVPFVDPLTTMLDPTLPLTVLEREEWGDPLNDADAYRVIRAYAPYEQVRPGVRYPPVLATTSINDTRVRFVEPAKWIARLRELAPEGGPYLLKTTMDAGHGGASGRYEVWRERAFDFAWLLTQLGA